MRRKGLLLKQSGNGMAQEVQGMFEKFLFFSGERKSMLQKICSPKYTCQLKNLDSSICKHRPAPVV